MLKDREKHSRGFSLVELLIAMALGGTLLSALVSFVAISASSHAKLVMQQRLSEELHTLSHLIVDELRRAEFDHSATSFSKPFDPQESEFVDSLRLSEFPGEQSTSCIEYAYDKNKDGILNTSPSNENFGFRLKNKAIEMRQKGAKCESNGWQDISDSSVVTVEALKFSIQQASQTRRYINITLTASAKGYPQIQRSITRTLAKPTLP